MSRLRLFKSARVIAAVVVVGAIVAMAMWPESMTVDVATVTEGPLMVTVDEDGETRVRERFVISAPVAGRLERIELEPGDSVARGVTVLARIMPAPAPLIDPRTHGELEAAVAAARAAVGQAQAERNRAGAARVRAQSTLERQRALAEAGAISRDDLEAAETALRVAEEAARAAEFAVNRTQYELQLARARLQTPGAAGGGVVQLVAPIDGTVLKRLRQSASVVAAGEPLLEIGDPTQLEVVADLLSTDAVRIRPGTDVLIDQWGGAAPIPGRVRLVEPSGFMKVSALGVEEQRVNVIIDFVEMAEAARALGDGYRVEARVIVSRHDRTLKVPVGSLFRQGDGWAVFVVGDGVAHVQSVQLGERNESEGQILGGLTAGQTVVVHPPDTLTDRTRVSVRK